MNDKKSAQNIWSLGPGARKNLSVIESLTTWIQLNVLSRTEFVQEEKLNINSIFKSKLNEKLQRFKKEVV